MLSTTDSPIWFPEVWLLQQRRQPLLVAAASSWEGRHYQPLPRAPRAASWPEIDIFSQLIATSDANSTQVSWYVLSYPWRTVKSCHSVAQSSSPSRFQGTKSDSRGLSRYRPWSSMVAEVTMSCLSWRHWPGIAVIKLVARLSELESEADSSLRWPMVATTAISSYWCLWTETRQRSKKSCLGYMVMFAVNFVFCNID